MQKPEKPQKQIGDELDELILGELPAEDQDDFKLVAQEIESKQKAGWSLVESQWKKAMAKKKPRAKGKAKGETQGQGHWKIRAKTKGFAHGR